MSHAERICAALHAALLDRTPAQGRVTRSLERGYGFDVFPALLLHMTGDIPLAGAPVGVEMRELTIELELLADGDVPHSAGDELHAAAHAIVMESMEPEVACRSGSVSYEYDDENPALGIVRAQYHITYRRIEGDL